MKASHQHKRPKNKTVRACQVNYEINIKLKLLLNNNNNDNNNVFS